MVYQSFIFSAQLLSQDIEFWNLARYYFCEVLAIFWLIIWVIYSHGPPCTCTSIFRLKKLLEILTFEFCKGFFCT